MKTGWLCGVVSVCALFAVADGPKPGENWYVAVKKLALRKAPDALSAPLRSLSYRDKVEVNEVVCVALPSNGSGKFKEVQIPGWVRVSVSGEDGYLPSSSLASEWLIAHQDNNADIPIEATGVAKLGFSESESGELVAMRGAAGQGNVPGGSNVTAVSCAIVTSGQPDDAQVKEFLTQGGLVLNNRRKQTVVPVEKEGGLGNLAESTGRGGAAVFGFASGFGGKLFGQDTLPGQVAAAGRVASELIYNEIGPVQEYQLGKVVAARLLSSYSLLDSDHPACRYVRNVGAALAAVSNDPTPYHEYMFMVLNSDEVNAFAVPGGFVFVTTGMLRFLKDEDELVAILGHEMGHMELRHGMSAVGKEKVLKLFSLTKEIAKSSVSARSGAMNTLKGQLIKLGDELFGEMTTAIRNGYGVEMESQADWRSIQFSIALGCDTMALHDVLERFKADKGTYGGAGYPNERGSDVLKYREEFSYAHEEVRGRDIRRARYRSSCGL